MPYKEDFTATTLVFNGQGGFTIKGKDLTSDRGFTIGLK